MEHCNVNATGLAQYHKENQELADFFIQTQYLDNWKRQDLQLKANPNFIPKSLELIIAPYCNLACKYCYLHKHGKEIFNESCYDEELTIANLKTILKWMEYNEFNCAIEIFSGELLAQSIGYKVLEIIYEHEKQLPPELRCPGILIPTNFTFISSEELTQKVCDMRNKFLELGITLGLSASFDGKYMEENRPYKSNLDLPMEVIRDDAYYDKCFDFVKNNGGGFHPMIYSKNIEKWKDNFLWFQEMLAKHGLNWDHLYLLQVRNEEWTASQIAEFANFIEFLYDWVWEKENHDKQKVISRILDNNCFNILSSALIKCGRGLTCGIQSQLTIRVSDLMVYPCHRLGYEDFYCGQWVADEEKIFRYENRNIELMMGISTIHKESLPMCTDCPINELCIGPCLGAQYESNGNMFAPIPSVCALTHALIVATIKSLKKMGIFNDILTCVMPGIRRQLEYIEKEVFVNAK